MSKILLVEDDNNLREIYEARLMAEGYTIVTAPDGEAALAIASQEKPDLVISDVMMPNISGFDMLDIMRNTEGLRNVHVIMLTALSQAEDQARADALGADRYLVKSQVTLEDIVNNAKVLLGDNEPAAEPAAAPAITTPEPAAAPVVAAPVVADVPVATPPEPAQVSLPEPVITDEPVVAEPVAVQAAPVSIQPEPAVVTPPSEPVAEPIAEPMTAPEPVAQPTPVAEQPIPEPVAEPAVVPEPAVSEPVQQPVETAPVAEQPTYNDPTNGLSATLAQEEADIQAQINAFANQSVPQEPETQPVEPVQQPVETAPVAEQPTVPTPNDPVIAPPTNPVATPPEPASTQPVTPDVQPVVVQVEPVAPAPQPVAPAVEQPAETATPVAESASSSNDQLMAAAVDQLTASVATGVTNGVPQPVVIQPSAVPAPAAEQPPVVTPQSNTAIDPAQNPAAPAPEGPVVPKPASDGGTKVIQPISNPEAKPDINQLLAQEEAKEQGQGNVIPSSIAPQQPTQPNNAIRPEDIAL